MQQCFVHENDTEISHKINMFVIQCDLLTKGWLISLLDLWERDCWLLLSSTGVAEKLYQKT